MVKGVLRNTVVYVFILALVFTLTSSFAFAQLSDGSIFTASASCAPNLQIANVHKFENSHVSTTTYGKRICYQPTDWDELGDVLEYKDAATRNVCWGNNVVFKMTGATNAHIANPWAEANVYPGNVWCYGYLQCKGGTYDHPTTTKLLTTSGDKNAHVSPSSYSGTGFSNSITCVEPVCNQRYFGTHQSFPLLYSFNSDEEEWEFRNNDAVLGDLKLVQPNPSHNDRAMEVIPTGGDVNRITNLRITDWRGFAAVELFVMPIDAMPEGASMVITISAAQGSQAYDIQNYALETIRTGKWTKVRLPLYSAANAELFDLSTVQTISFNPTSGAGTMYVDTIGFIPASAEDNQWQVYYCDRYSEAGPYNWISDLDNSPNALGACYNTFGTEPTGANCCGDDYLEFYADDVAGCFKSIKVEPGDAFGLLNDDTPGAGQVCIGADCEGNTTHGRELKYAYDDETKFWACGTQAQQFKELNGIGANPGDAIFQYADYSVRKPNEGEACQTVGDYFCKPIQLTDGTYSGYWSTQTDNVELMDVVQQVDVSADSDGSEVVLQLGNIPITSGANRTVIKKDFDDSTSQQYSCCPQNYCWHDGQCYENMDNEPDNPGILLDSGDTRRCVDGSWFSGVLKRSPDGKEVGYCPSESWCLVNPDGIQGDPNNPQCLNSGETYLDLYCLDGDWSSRTAVTASTLLDFAKDTRAASKYDLYCDDYENTLNFLGERDGNQVALLLQGTVLATTDTQTADVCGPEGCVNNFCVLQSTSAADEVMFATSLNTNISNTQVGLGAVFDISCSETQEGLQECDYIGDEDIDGTWYYDAGSRSVIFVADDDSVLTDLKNSLSVALASFWRLIIPVNDDEASDVFSLSTRFNRAYVSSGYDVGVRGYSEEVFVQGKGYRNTFSVEYTDHENAQFVCDIVDNFLEQVEAADGEVDLTCEVSGNDAVIYSTNSGNPNTGLNSIWPRLTAYLRQTT